MRLTPLRAAIGVRLASKAIGGVLLRDQDGQTQIPFAMQFNAAFAVVDTVLPEVIHRGHDADPPSVVPDPSPRHQVEKFPVAAAR
jgi:hypothetical protein